jgi:MFS family permease
MAELSMSQWASYFAEKGLGVNKVLGDLLGPCMFGVFMGIGRTLYGVYGKMISLSKALVWCAVICSAGYLIVVFSPIPILSLVGCGVVGFGVSLMWPGTLSLASSRIAGGGTTLFAFLALFGDVGCTAGPTIVGLVSGAFNDDLKKGLALAIIFPVLMIIGVIAIVRKRKNKDNRAENCGEKVE